MTCHTSPPPYALHGVRSSVFGRRGLPRPSGLLPPTGTAELPGIPIAAITILVADNSGFYNANVVCCA